MKLLPDKIGGNKKQYIALGGLGVILIVVYLIEREPSAPAMPATSVKVTTTQPSIARQGPVVPEASNGPKLATRGGRAPSDFRPSIKLPEGVDVTKIDPTLKTELLVKLQKVPLEGGSRSVFDFGAPPPPPPPKVPPIKPEVIAAQMKAQHDAEEARKTVKPPPPPIPLKFYGYANKSAREAFFLDGEDIEIKGENDVIRNRYKVIRIGINSAVVEDLQTQSQQTLPLVAEVTS